MRKTIFALLTAFMFSNMAYAMHGGCENKALEKKLAGAAKTSFVNKCERDFNTGEATKVCDTKAAEKKLSGAAKTSFTKKCVNDTLTSNAQMACDAKAAEKKLAGAAKNSYTKKCVEDSTK